MKENPLFNLFFQFFYRFLLKISILSRPRSSAHHSGNFIYMHSYVSPLCGVHKIDIFYVNHAMWYNLYCLNGIWCMNAHYLFGLWQYICQIFFLNDVIYGIKILIITSNFICIYIMNRISYFIQILIFGYNNISY